MTKDVKQIKDKHFKLHKIELTAGRAYTLEMESKTLDTFLVLADPTGKGIAQNDDIAPGNTRLSRIDFTLAKTGRFTILATTFGAGQTGGYVLRVRGYEE